MFEPPKQNDLRRSKEITMNENRTLVVVPTYNERNNIVLLLDEVLEQSPSIDVLVVDDSSPDGTGELVRKNDNYNRRIFLITQPSKQGLGKAYQCGYQYAIDRCYPYVIGMDADFSHDPADINKFIRAVQSADYIVGSRWIPRGGLIDWPWHRLLLSRVANFYIYILHGTGIHDATSGFQCFRREVLDKIRLEEMHSSGYSFQLEAKYRAYLAGFRLMEVPIIFKDRTHGVSKIPRETVFETLWVALLLRFQRAYLIKHLNQA